MRGEFRKGDTIGVWTYDEKIHTDMPMLVWDKDKKEGITSDVVRYLGHQRFEGHSVISDKVLSSIAQVLERSERLTIILIHDGSERIRGTEFDADLNDLQKKYARSFRSAHEPMITILAARGGQVYDYTINYPDSINVPHTALPEPPPEPIQTNAVIVAAPPPVTNLPPVVPALPPRHIEIVMSGTNHLCARGNDVGRYCAISYERHCHVWRTAIATARSGSCAQRGASRQQSSASRGSI